MLLQRLVADAGLIITDPTPEMYVVKPVRWSIDLDEGGKLVGFMPLTGTGEPNDRGKPLPVPNRVRSGSAPPPLMLADNVKFVLGFCPSDATESECKKVRARHASFVRAHRELAEIYPEIDELKAVTRFLDSWASESDARRVGAEMRPDDVAVFAVDGRRLVEDPRLQEYWAENWEDFGAKEKASNGSLGSGQCLVCGRESPLPLYIPMKVRGLRGGQGSGTSIVSVNSAAYESYGLERGHSSPICAPCGRTATRALNALIASEDNHLAIGPTTFVFWSSDGQVDPGVFGASLSEPDSERVKRHFESYRKGTPVPGDMSAFHVAALSAASGRAIVRDWLETTLRGATDSLAAWFDLIAVVDAYDGEARPLPVYLLASGPFRDARKEMPSAVPRALIRTAIRGEPLPLSLLSRTVLRCRTGTRHGNRRENVTQARAALLRAVLAQQNGWEGGFMSRLEIAETSPAYLCGRLLAVIEQIQRAALGNVNTTVVDRYYASASSAPASVFGRLLSGAQAHLKKLRNTKGGVAEALQQRLEGVMSGLDGFPKTLRLEEQAMFSLGYYHQRAADRAAARERAAAKNDKATQEEDEER